MIAIPGYRYQIQTQSQNDKEVREIEKWTASTGWTLTTSIIEIPDEAFRSVFSFDASIKRILIDVSKEKIDQKASTMSVAY